MSELKYCWICGIQLDETNVIYDLRVVRTTFMAGESYNHKFCLSCGRKIDELIDVVFAHITQEKGRIVQKLKIQEDIFTKDNILGVGIVRAKESVAEWTESENTMEIILRTHFDLKRNGYYSDRPLYVSKKQFKEVFDKLNDGEVFNDTIDFTAFYEKVKDFYDVIWIYFTD